MNTATYTKCGYTILSNINNSNISYCTLKKIQLINSTNDVATFYANVFAMVYIHCPVEFIEQNELSEERRKKNRESFWKEQLFKHFSFHRSNLFSYFVICCLRYGLLLLSLPLYFSVPLACDRLWLVFAIYCQLIYRCLFNYHPRWMNMRHNCLTIFHFEWVLSSPHCFVT